MRTPGGSWIRGWLVGLVVTLLAIMASGPPPLEAVPRRGVQAAPMSRDSSYGFALKAYRTALGFTQASLAAATRDSVTGAVLVSSTKISRVERGLDTLTLAQEDRIADALFAVVHRRFHPSAKTRLTAAVMRYHARARLRQALAPGTRST